MKRNLLTLVVGTLLLVIFGLLLFVFQVRKSEVKVVTTFGKLTTVKTEPGAYFKWPWPIQKVHKLDQRLQNFEDRFEEVLTPDGYNLLANVYVGWRISDPKVFFPKFGDSVAQAEKTLEAVVRNAKNATVGQHPLSHFISTDENELKFSDIENEILKKVQGQLTASNYGIEIKFVGIKKLGLPESVTQNVFERMKSERQVLIAEIENKGKAEADIIRSTAERDASKILAEADAQATRIRSEGQAKAKESLAVFQKNPELAVFLLQLEALETMLKEKSTLVLDQNTPPLNLLNPAQPSQKNNGAAK